MASEAQHLINISLGKIASSRNQRGGLRLHKSLMVANVIVQARTQAMMETGFSPSRSHSHRSTTTVTSTSKTKEEEDSRVPSVDLDDTLGEEVDSDSESTFDSDDESMTVDYELEFGSKANSPPLSMAKKCRKRKRNIDYDDEEDSETSPKPAKKFATPTTVQTTHNTGNDCTNSLLDSLQMCHLNQEFATDFTSSSLYEPQDFTKLNDRMNAFDEDEFHVQGFDKLAGNSETFGTTLDDTDVSLFQPDSHGEVISCSTQIREALETLTRPVISLTV